DAKGRFGACRRVGRHIGVKQALTIRDRHATLEPRTGKVEGERPMFAVIFEVQPRKERFDEYLALAKALRPRLDAIDGFIDIDRFASKRTEGRVLSLPIFRDDKAVTRWRTHATHHGAQEKGRFEIFADYRLRVGEITADTAPPQGYAVVQQRFDATETGDAKVVTISEITGAQAQGEPDALAAQLGLR